MGQICYNSAGQKKKLFLQYFRYSVSNDYVVSVFKSILVLSLHFCITSTYCENFYRFIFFIVNQICVNKTQQIRKINNQEEIYS